jgi:hypothetical protein
MQCANCGAQLTRALNDSGELIDVNTERPHDCPNKPAKKKSKYGPTVRINVDGKEYNAMYCKYGCNNLVYRDDSLRKEPKLVEYQTGRNHNIQRCGNIQVDDGRWPHFIEERYGMKRNIFASYTYLLELADYSPEDQESLRSHYPNPEQSKWYNPEGWYQAKEDARKLQKL